MLHAQGAAGAIPFSIKNNDNNKNQTNWTKHSFYNINVGKTIFVKNKSKNDLEEKQIEIKHRATPGLHPGYNRDYTWPGYTRLHLGYARVAPGCSPGPGGNQGVTQV